MQKTEQEITEYIKKARDERRPSMELVVQTLDALFSKLSENGTYQAVSRGPDMWSWLDTTNIGSGFERWIIVSQSAMEGTEGHPLVTIRQHTAPRMDAWLVVSQLLVGRDARELETSFAMALANHQGAFEGLKEMVANVIQLFEQTQSSNVELVKPFGKDVN